MLIQVNLASTNDDLYALIGESNLGDVLVNAGYLEPLTLQNKNLAMQSLLVYDVLLKRKEPLDQLRKGLESLGILNLMESHTDMMQPFFMDVGCELLTSDYLIGKFSTGVLHSEKVTTAYQFLIDAIKALEKGEFLSNTKY